MWKLEFGEVFFGFTGRMVGVGGDDVEILKLFRRPLDRPTPCGAQTSLTRMHVLLAPDPTKPEKSHHIKYKMQRWESEQITALQLFIIDTVLLPEVHFLDQIQTFRASPLAQAQPGRQKNAGRVGHKRGIHSDGEKWHIENHAEFQTKSTVLSLWWSLGWRGDIIQMGSGFKLWTTNQKVWRYFFSSPNTFPGKEETMKSVRGPPKKIGVTNRRCAGGSRDAL